MCLFKKNVRIIIPNTRIIHLYTNSYYFNFPTITQNQDK